MKAFLTSLLYFDWLKGLCKVSIFHHTVNTLHGLQQCDGGLEDKLSQIETFLTIVTKVELRKCNADKI